MPAFATGLTVAVTQVKSHHRITVIHQLQAAYQLDHLPAQQEVLAIAEKWRPYRSLATSYLFSAAFEPAGSPDLHATVDHEADARHI